MQSPKCQSSRTRRGAPYVRGSGTIHLASFMFFYQATSHTRAYLQLISTLSIYLSLSFLKNIVLYSIQIHKIAFKHKRNWNSCKWHALSCHQECNWSSFSRYNAGYGTKNNMLPCDGHPAHHKETCPLRLFEIACTCDHKDGWKLSLVR